MRVLWNSVCPSPFSKISSIENFRQTNKKLDSVVAEQMSYSKFSAKNLSDLSAVTVSSRLQKLLTDV